jgi:hypothetical protein
LDDPSIGTFHCETWGQESCTELCTHQCTHEHPCG